MTAARKAEWLLLLITFGWGTTFVIVKIGVDTVPPFMYLAMRFLGAAILFAAVFHKWLFPLPFSLINSALLLSLWNFLGFSAQTAGLQFTSATNSGFITGSYVVFTPLLQWMLYRKRASGSIWVAVFLSFFGLYLLSVGELMPSVALVQQPNAGDGLTLVCALFFALFIIELDRLSKRSEVMSIPHAAGKLAFVQILFCGIASLFVSLFLESPMLPPLSTSFIGGLIYLMLGPTLISTLIQTKYQKDTTPERAALIFMFEAVFSAIFAFFLLREILTPVAYVGALLMVLSIYIAEFKS